MIGDIIDRKLKIWPKDSFKFKKTEIFYLIEYRRQQRGLVKCLSEHNINKTQVKVSVHEGKRTCIWII